VLELAFAVHLERLEPSADSESFAAVPFVVVAFVGSASFVAAPFVVVAFAGLASFAFVPFAVVAFAGSASSVAVPFAGLASFAAVPFVAFAGLASFVADVAAFVVAALIVVVVPYSSEAQRPSVHHFVVAYSDLAFLVDQLVPFAVEAFVVELGFPYQPDFPFAVAAELGSGWSFAVAKDLGLQLDCPSVVAEDLGFRPDLAVAETDLGRHPDFVVLVADSGFRPN